MMMNASTLRIRATFLRKGFNQTKCKQFRIPCRFSGQKAPTPVSMQMNKRTLSKVAIGGISGGFLGGLVGVGGSLIMTPFLRHFTSLTTHEIIGASTVGIMGGTLIATLSYMQQKNGMICYPIVITMTTCGMFGATIGVRLSHLIPSHTLTFMTGCMLFMGIFPVYTKYKQATAAPAVQSQLKKNSNTSTHKKNDLHEKNMKATRIFFNNPVEWLKSGNNYQYVIVGTVAGMLTGLMSLGGGIISVAYLAGYTDLTQHQVIGTCLSSAFGQSLAAGIVHASSGTVGIPLMAVLACGNAVGMFAASRTVPNVEEKYLQIALCLLFLVGSMRMGTSAYSMWKIKK